MQMLVLGTTCSGNFKKMSSHWTEIVSFQRKLITFTSKNVKFSANKVKVKKHIFLPRWACRCKLYWHKSCWQVSKIFCEVKSLSRMIRWKIWRSLCQTFIVESFWFTSFSLRIHPARHVSNDFQKLKNVSQENIWWSTMFGKAPSE